MKIKHFFPTKTYSYYRIRRVEHLNIQINIKKSAYLSKKQNLFIKKKQVNLLGVCNQTRINKFQTIVVRCIFFIINIYIFSFI